LSRSLILAFLSALTLHSVAALVDLSAFKRHSSVKICPKTLTMNIIVPQPVKKLSISKKSLRAVDRPVAKKRIPKKVTPKKRVKQRVERKKKIQPEKQIMQKRMPETEELLSYLPPPEIPQINKKGDDFFEENTVFKPDMVDIPKAIPNMSTSPQKENKDNRHQQDEREGCIAPPAQALPVFCRPADASGHDLVFDDHVHAGCRDAGLDLHQNCGCRIVGIGLEA